MPPEPDPRRRRASDREPDAFLAQLAREYAGPWERLARWLTVPAGSPGTAEPVRPLRPLARWLARKDRAWLTRHAMAGSRPSEMWRR